MLCVSSTPFDLIPIVVKVIRAKQYCFHRSMGPKSLKSSMGLTQNIPHISPKCTTFGCMLVTYKAVQVEKKSVGNE